MLKIVLIGQKKFHTNFRLIFDNFDITNFYNFKVLLITLYLNVLL
jgi:hypothetical protein